MLLKYHPEWQFRLQSYKHLRTYTALLLYKRKPMTFIHVNKIVCIVARFQNQSFSLLFYMCCGATPIPFKTFPERDRQIQVQRRACGLCETHALGHFCSGQHQRMQTGEPQACTPGSPDTVQAMQRTVDSASTP